MSVDIDLESMFPGENTRDDMSPKNLPSKQNNILHEAVEEQNFQKLEIGFASEDLETMMQEENELCVTPLRSAMIRENKEMILKMAKKYVELFPEETYHVLQEPTLSLGESDGEVMKYVLIELDDNQVRKALDRSININSYELLERYIVRGDRDLVRILVSKGAKPREETFHEVIKRVQGKPKRHKDVARALHEVFQRAGNHREFESVARIKPDPELLKLLTHRPDSRSEYKAMNAVEYACYEQNEDILKVLMNAEGALKFYEKNPFPGMTNFVSYDITDLTPETQMKRTSISCLEILLCSSFDLDRELRAAKIIDSTPFVRLTRTYLKSSERITWVFTMIHFLYMCSFTVFTFINNTPLNNDTNEMNATLINESDTNDEARSSMSVLYFLWIIWPALSTLMAMFNLKALTSVGETNTYKCTELLFTIFVEVGFFGLMLAFIVCAMATDISFSYHFVSTLLIVGWLSTLKYVTLFGSVNALVTQLRSYIIKDIVSFAAVFIFVFLGFSFAIRALLLCQTPNSSKSWYEVMYMTYSTLHGMGELTNYAGSDGKGSDLTMVFVICFYFTVTAILVMAMINKPFDDVMVQYTNDRFLRVKVHRLRNIMWFISLTRLLRWYPERLKFKKLENSCIVDDLDKKVKTKKTNEKDEEKEFRSYTFPMTEMSIWDREEESDFNEMKQMYHEIKKKIEDVQTVLTKLLCPCKSGCVSKPPMDPQTSMQE